MKFSRLLLTLILVNSTLVLPAQLMPGLKQGAIRCGAERPERYLEQVKGKKVGIVANPTSRVGALHLVDTLLRSGVGVERVFAPEHGFRGEGEAGALIEGGADPLTGLPVVSLYGKHKKPTPEDLKGLDLVLFDIQDVGVRFYTYISTLHLVMEACAEEGVAMMVFDRPNPNGFYIDGPVLDTAFRSFVGMHPVPVVHGMTIGEYARMINGEGWLPDGLRCELTVIPCQGYDHETEYILPVRPSPNLPNQVSVYLYPTLCFFEGSVVSIGRGTAFPFQVYGHPDLTGAFRFTPESLPGFSLHPQHEGKVCTGVDLRDSGLERIARQRGLVLEWIILAWKGLGGKAAFFTDYFDTLAGSEQLRKQILAGLSPEEIRKGWEAGLDAFRVVRAKYLLYPDFRVPGNQ